MHQTAVSTADHTNGADLGIRQEWLPLFDRYQVDLVVCGHEHHYERSHPVRGALDTETRTPIPVETHSDVIDTSKGTVHLVIGGGGTSAPSNTMFFPQPKCRVLTSVGPFDPAIGRKAPFYVVEDAPWSAFRDRRKPLRLRCFRCGSGFAGRQHVDQGDALRGQRPLWVDQCGRTIHPDSAPRRLSLSYACLL